MLSSTPDETLLVILASYLLRICSNRLTGIPVRDNRPAVACADTLVFVRKSVARAGSDTTRLSNLVRSTCITGGFRTRLRWKPVVCFSNFQNPLATKCPCNPLHPLRSLLWVLLAHLVPTCCRLILQCYRNTR